MKAKYYIGISSMLLLTFSTLTAQRTDLRDYRNDGARQVVNNYYNDYDYYFTSRINRFHRSYVAFDYYAPVFTEPYWNSYRPFSWGLGIFGGIGLGLGFSFNYPMYDYGYGNYYGYDPYYGSDYYWGYNPFYDNWYSPWIFNFNFGYRWHNNYFGWFGHSYNRGYHNYYARNDYRNGNYYNNHNYSHSYSSSGSPSRRGSGKDSESSLYNNKSRRGNPSGSNIRNEVFNNRSAVRSGNSYNAGENRRTNFYTDNYVQNSNIRNSGNNRNTRNTSNYSNDSYPVHNPRNINSEVNNSRNNYNFTPSVNSNRYVRSNSASAPRASGTMRAPQVRSSSARSSSSGSGMRSSSSHSSSRSSGSRSGSSGGKSSGRR